MYYGTRCNSTEKDAKRYNYALRRNAPFTTMSKRVESDIPLLMMAGGITSAQLLVDKSKEPYPKLIRICGRRFGTRDVKCAVTDSRDIGKLVARIIVDERTLKRYVFCWAQEVTQNELFAIAERVFGHKIDTGTFSEEERLYLLHHGDDLERNTADYV
ncbi:hypothetical protein ACEPAF_3105 [Sanghuangporus sanghuang]